MQTPLPISLTRRKTSPPGWRTRLFGLLLVLLGSVSSSWAQTSGIFEGYAILGISGGPSTYYDLNGTAQSTQTGNPDFNGSNLGTFNPTTSTLVLRGAQLKTFKNSGDNVTSARLQYRLYAGTTGSGAFTAVNLPFDQNLSNPGDQQWQQTAGTTNLLAGLANGSYTLEVYGEISTNSGAKFYSDGGANYKATFTVNNPTATLINETFETGNTFTVVNGAAINAWNVGTAAGNGPSAAGTRAAYISNNGGTAHAYTISSAISVVHLYQDVTFPAGQSVVQLALDWRGQGESSASFDNLQLFLIPTTVTPAASNSGALSANSRLQNSGYTPFATLTGQAAFTSSTLTLPASVAGTTQRLVLQWYNDNSGGTQPPAAVDNVVLTARTATTPLSGTYTINNTLATTGRNFASFTAAINALNAEGVEGAVTFEVANGQTFTENTPAITASGSSGNLITFREATLSASLADNPTIVVTGSGNSTDAGIILTGADYVVFDGINVGVASGNTAVEYGYLVRNTSDGTNGAQNNVVRNARIVLSRTLTGSVGVLQTASTTGGGANASTSNATVSTNRFNQYYNLTIENVYKGIYLLTGNTSGAAYDDNTQVYNNSIGGATAGDIGGGSTATSGIQATRQNNLSVYGNTVRNVSSTTTLYGIYIERAFGPAMVYNNRVSGIRNTSTSATTVIYGMALDVDVSTVATGHRLTAYNNFVWDLLHGATGTASATRRTIGIATQTGGTGANNFIDLYHNSVRIEVPAAHTASSTAFESQTTTTGPVLTLRNNIFTNFSAITSTSATPRHSAIASSSATAFGAAGSTSDFNDLYVGPGNGNVVGRGSTTDYATLATWQAAYPGYGVGGATIDASSVSVNPLFVSATDLHLQDSSPLNNVGTPVAAVTTDIDGDARSTTAPDLGGDEFTPQTTDIAVTAINGPAVPFAAGSFPVTITVANNGSTTVTSAEVSYTLNGTLVPVGTVALSLAPNTSTTVSLGNVTFQPGANTLVVSVLNPNGAAEVAPANLTNNTLTETFTPGLTGAYTINNNAAASLTNFVSFTAAATALNNGGVVGAVTFAVDAASGPYAEQMTLNVIPGTSATNTVTFNGNGRTIQFASADANRRAVIQLNGSDFVTLSNLVVNAAGGTYGWGIHLSNGADDNQILNSTITTDVASTSSTNFVGIVAVSSNTSLSTAGNAANRTLIEANTVTGGYRGIALYGSTTALNTGNVVRNNVVREFYVDGLQAYGQSGVQLIGNDISRPTRTAVSAFTGISVEGSTRAARVERNRIHASFTGNTASTAVAYGLYITGSDAVAGQENDFVNNLVYGFNGAGTEYGIYNSSSDFARYYFNSVSLDNTASSGTTQTTYAFYQITSATGMELKNNILVATRTGGSGNKIALYLSTAGYTTANLQSDYNDLFVGTGSVFFTGHDGTNSHVTLQNWQDNTPFDDNSVQADPQFDAAATTPLTPTTVAVNAKGIALAGITTDYNNVTRSTPPDLGAVEFTPAALDLGAVALVSPAATGCYSANQPVVVRIQNLGGGTINFAQNNATVSGAVTGAATQSFGPVTLTTGTLAVGATQDVQIGTLDMTPTGTYTFTATAAVAGETNTANNDLAAAARTQNGVTALSPQARTVDFTGFTGSNLATVFPGWREAEGAVTPTGTTSNWTSATFGNATGSANGTAAKLDLDAVNEDGWIISPRFAVTATTELTYDLALTNSGVTTAGTLDADDLFEVRISTDCGATYQPLRTYNSAGPSISGTGQTETINLGDTYAGQEVILGFFATEGPTVTGNIDLFLDNISLRSPLADDAGVVAIVDPVMPFTPTVQTVSAQVKNFGVETLDEVTVNWTVNGVAQAPQTFTGLNLAPGATSASLTLGTFDFSAVGPRFVIEATTSLPNGNPDLNAANNTTTRTVIPTLAGTFTINSALPTGGGNGNFASFTDAAEALNMAGVGGPVVFNVDAASGPYTERLVLNAIAGASATNTVTFNGNGRTLQFGTTTSAERAVVQLNGADFVTLDNLSINADVSGSSYGWGIHLTNAADNNTVRNVTITSSVTSTSTNYAGIVASGSATSATTAGNAANALTLEGNTIVGGYYGVILYGSTSALNTANVMRTNTVREFYLDGIQAYGQNGVQIVGNNISRPTRANGSTFTGISVEGSTRGALVARNRVHTPFGGNTTSTSTAYGLYVTASDAVAGQENTFVNNLVYNFNGSGIEYGIYNTSSDFARYYFNSVSLDNQAANAATQATYGFYQTTLAAGIELRNNVFSVTRVGGTGSKYALYFNTPATTFTSNYNDLFVGTGSGYVTGYANSTARATLADWRTATSQDLSSVQGNPGFTSATDLMPNPANPNSYYLNGTGVQLPGFGTDFNGNPRPTTVAAGAPDLGAYEFTPTAQPNALTTTGTYALGGTQDFFFAGRRMATITYGTTGTLPTTLTARYYPGTNPRTPLAGARYLNSFLELLPSADGVDYTYDLVLYYDDALLGTVDPESALRLSRRDVATGLYEFYAQATLDAAANTLAQTGLTSFGEFTGSDQAAPLPVSLTSFEAARQGSNALLTWTTAQEKDNRGFEVQVSVDGRTFRPLGFVASESPNSTTARRYRFVDAEAGKQGLRYYRLRQLDQDGKQAFFGPRTVQFEQVTKLAAVAFPNPFTGQELTLEVTAPASAATELLLLDALGRTVLRQTVNLQAGVQRLPLQLTGEPLPAGAYLLRLTSAGQTSTLRVVKH